jgi:hypothetical protein
MYTIQQLTLDQQSQAGGRQVRVTFANGQTYTVADAGGDYCFQNLAYSLTAETLNENTALREALTAVGEFYRFWLSGNEDPMVLMLRKDTPVLHELYESEETNNTPEQAADPAPGKDYPYALACSIFTTHKDPDLVERALIYEDDAVALLRAIRQAGLSDALPVILGTGAESIELSMNEKGFYFLTQVDTTPDSEDKLYADVRRFWLRRKTEPVQDVITLEIGEFAALVNRISKLRGTRSYHPGEDIELPIAGVFLVKREHAVNTKPKLYRTGLI